MPEQFAYNVFLSHCSKDKAVRPLAELLRADGRPLEGKVGFQPLAFSLQPLLRAFGSGWVHLVASTLHQLKRSQKSQGNRYVILC
jgi:hypothetical protein